MKGHFESSFLLKQALKGVAGVAHIITGHAHNQKGLLSYLNIFPKGSTLSELNSIVKLE